MTRKSLRLFAACLPALFAIGQATAAVPANQPDASVDRGRMRQPGFPRVHDPSRILQCGGEYRVFATGNGVVSLHSKDLWEWSEGPRVFAAPPAWTTNTVPGNRGYFWAPDVIRLKDEYFLYYSVSTFGKNASALGLATNPTLDPSDPRYIWKDRGIVLTSASTDNYNAIDPSVMLDRDGRLWLAFGSFWSGLKLVELNPETGLRKDTNTPLHSIAWNSSIEAACIHRRDDRYYLFVNWGACCKGTNSTYEIRVGRSSAITGPYLDKMGNDLMSGGGSLFLATEGFRIGPGHTAILETEGKEYFSYHYYHAERGGRPGLQVRRLDWTDDGWPVAGELLVPP